MTRNLPSPWHPFVDHVFDSMFGALLNEFPKFPPVNVYTRRGDDRHIVLEFALSGYTPDDVDIHVETVQGRRTLTVRSDGINENARNTDKYLHRGIAGRSFAMSYSLAPNVKVESADLENGLLSVHLNVEEPEQASSIKKIAIGKPVRKAIPGYAGEPPPGVDN